MFNKLSPREKKLLIVLGIILVGFVFYKYVLQIQIAKMSQLEEAYAAEENKLAQAKKIAGSYDDVAFEAKTTKKDLDFVKSRFVTNSADGTKEVEFGLDARNNSVRVVLFQPLEVITNDEYIELPIRMEVRAQYQQILEFLTAIDSFYNIAEIKDLVLKNEDQDGLSSTPELKASFTFSIYTTNPPEEDSRYTDLSQWTVGRLNSFSAGIRAIAKFEPIADTSSNQLGNNETSGKQGNIGADNGALDPGYYPNNSGPKNDEDIILK